MVVGTGPWVVFDEEAVGPKRNEPALDMTYARTKSISTCSWKGHFKLGKIAKFGGVMLYKKPKI